DYLALALCGAAAILCVALYARFTGTLQRVLVDPVKYVRPEPAPDKVPGWAVVPHVLIGLVVFLAMASIKLAPGEYRAQVGTYGSLGLVLGWCIAGRALLSFFWPKARIPALLRVRQR